MTEQVEVDCYAATGMSLWRAIQWIDRNVLRRSDPVLGWRAVLRETRARPRHCWHT